MVSLHSGSDTTDTGQGLTSLLAPPSGDWGLLFSGWNSGQKPLLAQFFMFQVPCPLSSFHVLTLCAQAVCDGLC